MILIRKDYREKIRVKLMKNFRCIRKGKKKNLSNPKNKIFYRQDEERKGLKKRYIYTYKYILDEKRFFIQYLPL